MHVRYVCPSVRKTGRQTDSNMYGKQRSLAAARAGRIGLRPRFVGPACPKVTAYSPSIRQGISNYSWLGILVRWRCLCTLVTFLIQVLLGHCEIMLPRSHVPYRLFFKAYLERTPVGAPASRFSLSLSLRYSTAKSQLAERSARSLHDDEARAIYPPARCPSSRLALMQC